MNKPKIQGFTLLELIIAVAIMGITLSLALPSITGILAENRLTSAANDMVSALQVARSESIKQVRQGVVCITGTTWVSSIGACANVLQNYQAPRGVSLTITGGDINAQTPTYNSDGRLVATQNITIEFTNPDTPKKRVLTATPTGRITVTQ